MVSLDADKIFLGNLSIYDDDRITQHTIWHPEACSSKIIIDLDIYNYKVKDNQLILTKKEAAE